MSARVHARRFSRENVLNTSARALQTLHADFLHSLRDAHARTHTRTVRRSISGPSGGPKRIVVVVVAMHLQYCEMHRQKMRDAVLLSALTNFRRCLCVAMCVCVCRCLRVCACWNGMGTLFGFRACLVFCVLFGVCVFFLCFGLRAREVSSITTVVVVVRGSGIVRMVVVACGANGTCARSQQMGRRSTPAGEWDL